MCQLMLDLRDSDAAGRPRSSSKPDRAGSESGSAARRHARTEAAAQASSRLRAHPKVRHLCSIGRPLVMVDEWAAARRSRLARAEDCDFALRLISYRQFGAPIPYSKTSLVSDYRRERLRDTRALPPDCRRSAMQASPGLPIANLFLAALPVDDLNALEPHSERVQLPLRMILHEH